MLRMLPLPRFAEEEPEYSHILRLLTRKAGEVASAASREGALRPDLSAPVKPGHDAERVAERVWLLGDDVRFSDRHVAAVHGDGAAGRPARLVGGQKKDRPDKIVGLA
jgi:hypothetical protein